MMLLDENELAVLSDEYYHAPAPHKLDVLAAPAQPEARTFGIPAIIWGSMAASYALFFLGLILGTGHDGRALFMIAVSMLYTAMYFGTVFALNSLSGSAENEKSQWIKGKFDTFTGRMSFGAVYGQMLIVPMVFAFFGISIAIIRSIVM
ncbi:MAG: hypothetical protein ABJP02_03350 [Parasphingorhabdus sp.]|uniref:hypothetical protein n=1 Tax=Parasphingorhabdus sp. TaxID=2709688 RepID=UPI003299F814